MGNILDSLKLNNNDYFKPIDKSKIIILQKGELPYHNGKYSFSVGCYNITADVIIGECMNIIGEIYTPIQTVFKGHIVVNFNGIKIKDGYATNLCIYDNVYDGEFKDFIFSGKLTNQKNKTYKEGTWTKEGVFECNNGTKTYKNGTIDKGKFVEDLLVEGECYYAKSKHTRIGRFENNMFMEGTIKDQENKIIWTGTFIEYNNITVPHNGTVTGLIRLNNKYYGKVKQGRLIGHCITPNNILSGIFYDTTHLKEGKKIHDTYIIIGKWKIDDTLIIDEGYKIDYDNKNYVSYDSINENGTYDGVTFTAATGIKKVGKFEVRRNLHTYPTMISGKMYKNNDLVLILDELVNNKIHKGMCHLMEINDWYYTGKYINGKFDGIIENNEIKLEGLFNEYNDFVHGKILYKENGKKIIKKEKIHEVYENDRLLFRGDIEHKIQNKQFKFKIKKGQYFNLLIHNFIFNGSFENGVYNGTFYQPDVQYIGYCNESFENFVGTKHYKLDCYVTNEKYKEIELDFSSEYPIKIKINNNIKNITLTLKDNVIKSTWTLGEIDELLLISETLIEDKKKNYNNSMYNVILLLKNICTISNNVLKNIIKEKITMEDINDLHFCTKCYEQLGYTPIESYKIYTRIH